MEIVPTKVQEYRLDDTYNMNKTRLNFKIFSIQTHVRGDQAKSVRGTELMKAESWLMLFFTRNASCTDLLFLAMIGKTKNPCCFKCCKKY